MKTLTVSIFVILTTVLGGHSEDKQNANNPKRESVHYMHSDWLLGKVFTSTVSGEAYSKMKQWNLGSSKVPPVSPQDALKIGEAYVKQIRMPKGYSLRFKDIAIIPIGGKPRSGKCIWLLTFSDNQNGASASLQLLVSMDGNLITPQVRQQQPRAKSEE